ncbi:MAG: acyl-CoA thioesterase [Actinobacteria bacterium]|nr:acyl-CoA thioesterase [Actinomycetota bacterium]MCB0920556.1 acyl-CoA thioesterase [Actinomycetota bacterium]
MTVMGPACFRYDSAVFFDEMDPLGVMHNSRFAVHVERAQTALFEHLGYGWTDLSQRHEDIVYVVRDMAMEFTAPVSSPGVMRVEVVALRLGRTSATWGYRCTCGDVPVANGTRVVVKVDGSARPVPWTDSFRTLFGWLAGGAQGTRP